MAQRQWRSDDTSTWNYGFGDGSDGDLTISGNTTEAPIDASCSGTSGTTSLSATNVSFAIGQLILIHQTRGTGVGGWELNKIAGYTAGTITTAHDLTMTYTDSGASQAQVRVLKQYNNVTVNSGITYTAKAWNGDVGGILGFFSKGTTTVTGTITASANGYAGGYFPGGNNSGRTGEGTSGASFVVGDIQKNGSGGGSARNNQKAKGSGGGNGAAGGNGSIESGTVIAGGDAAGAASLVTMAFGGGAGTGADDNGAGAAHYGGYGGGIIFIAGKIITITGSISNGGSQGGNSGYWPAGGGAGGSTLLKASSATLGSTLVTAAAGSGGSSGAGSGGAGSVGRIHLDYSGSYTGTTSPTIDATNDTSITEPSSGAFFGMF